jgi:hypothetical protein
MRDNVPVYFSSDGNNVAQRELITRLKRDVYSNVGRAVCSIRELGFIWILAIVEVTLVDEGGRAGGALERAAPAHLAANARLATTRVGYDDIPFRALIAGLRDRCRAHRPVRSRVDDLKLGIVDATACIWIPHVRPIICGN